MIDGNILSCFIEYISFFGSKVLFFIDLAEHDIRSCLQLIIVRYLNTLTEFFRCKIKLSCGLFNLSFCIIDGIFPKPMINCLIQHFLRFGSICIICQCNCVISVIFTIISAILKYLIKGTHSILILFHLHTAFRFQVVEICASLIPHIQLFIFQNVIINKFEAFLILLLFIQRARILIIAFQSRRHHLYRFLIDLFLFLIITILTIFRLLIYQRIIFFNFFQFYIMNSVSSKHNKSCHQSHKSHPDCHLPFQKRLISLILSGNPLQRLKHLKCTLKPVIRINLHRLQNNTGK